MKRRKLITVTEYAKKQAISRDAVYKRIYEDRMPKGDKVVKVAGQNFISILEEKEG